MVHVEEVLRRLREADVKLNPKKCRFVKQEVEYLGNVVTPEGVSPNPEKVHVVQEFPTPPNVKEPFLLFVDASSTGISFTLAQVQNSKEVRISEGFDQKVRLRALQCKLFRNYCDICN